LQKIKKIILNLQYSKLNKIPLKREIFQTGEYIQYFYPDEKCNPFHKIYKKKKEDTLNIINQSEDCKRILDIGGGGGRLAINLANSSQKEIILADISLDMLKFARRDSKELNNLEAVNSDAHFLPFRDNSYDIVVGLDLFCHLKNPEKALKEFYRVLTDQGLLILDSTNSNSLWAFFYPRYIGKNPLNWLKIIKFQGVYPGWEAIVKHYPKKKFFLYLKKMGFKVIQNLNYGPKLCPKWHLVVAQKMN
jgi:glycogen(starch) synthase